MKLNVNLCSKQLIFQRIVILNKALVLISWDPSPNFGPGLLLLRKQVLR